jgi:hypothetical protein
MAPLEVGTGARARGERPRRRAALLSAESAPVREGLGGGASEVPAAGLDPAAAETTTDMADADSPGPDEGLGGATALLSACETECLRWMRLPFFLVLVLLLLLLR